MKLKHVRLVGASFMSERKATTLESFKHYEDYFDDQTRFQGFNCILL
jgi:hypothetical protein